MATEYRASTLETKTGRRVEVTLCIYVEMPELPTWDRPGQGFLAELETIILENGIELSAPHRFFDYFDEQDLVKLLDEDL